MMRFKDDEFGTYTKINKALKKQQRKRYLYEILILAVAFFFLSAGFAEQALLWLLWLVWTGVRR